MIFGIEPGPRLQELQRWVLSPPLQPARGRVPARRSGEDRALVGRDAELAELVRSGGVVTVSGCRENGAHPASLASLDHSSA